MSYSIKCSCGQTLKLKEELLGKAIRCPKCAQTLKIKSKTQPADVIMEAEVVQTEPLVGAPRAAVNTSLPPSTPSHATVPNNPQDADDAPLLTMKAKITAVSTYLGLSVGSVMLLGAGLFMAANSLSSYSWGTTQGTILRSAVTSKIESSNRIKSRGVPDQQSKQRIIVEYQYDVDGKAFTNDRISFRFTEGNNIDTLNALAMKYSKESTVQVHYNASDPTESVLEPGIPGVAWIFLIVGALLLVACAFGLPHLRAYLKKPTTG